MDNRMLGTLFLIPVVKISANVLYFINRIKGTKSLSVSMCPLSEVYCTCTCTVTAHVPIKSEVNWNFSRKKLPRDDTNCSEEVKTVLDQDVKALVDSDGNVTWVPPERMTSPCRLNIQRFPYDSHICRLSFGSWAHDGYVVSVPLHQNWWIRSGDGGGRNKDSRNREKHQM